ncbi:MAG TPA: hypothetical protein V6C93_10585 [Allocoleopsis sp.]
MRSAITRPCLLFGWEIRQSLSGIVIAAHVAQVIVEFLDFEEVEDSLRFEDSVLFEEEVSKTAISGCNGFGE